MKCYKCGRFALKLEYEGEWYCRGCKLGWYQSS